MVIHVRKSIINISCINNAALECFANQNVRETSPGIISVNNKMPFVTSNPSQIVTLTFACLS